MLVVDIEVVEYGEVMVFWRIWLPLVRLNLVQSLPHGHRDARLDIGIGAASLISLARRLAHWEEGVAIWRLLASRYDELPGEIVKRNAEVVDGIANDRAQNGRDRRHLAKPEDVLRPLFITLADHFARRADRADLIVEVVQM